MAPRIPLPGGFNQYRKPIGNMMSDLGYGISQGGFKKGFGIGAGRMAEMAPYRAQMAGIEEQKAEEAEQENQTLEWLRQKGAEDPRFAELAKAVESGGMDVGTAWQTGLSYINATPDLTAEQRNFQYSQENPGFADFLNPSKPPTPTDDMREYQYAQQQGYEGSFTDYQTEMRKAGATNIDLNANQGAAAAYADRMVSADAVLSDPLLTKAMGDLTEQIKGNVPVAGNFLVSKEYQMAEQAQRDFINAVLRRESGAVISPSEFENAKKQYFPQPGDGPEVIEQKARNRRTAIDGVARAAGSTYAAPQPMQQPGGVVDYTTYFGGQ